jgi:hypothetical protein
MPALICLILLGLTGDFLVDWMWFSTVGYLDVFWTTIVAEAGVFFAVFLATAIILWVNGLLASRFAGSPWTQRPADFEWKRTGVVTLPDVLEFVRNRGPPSLLVAPASSPCWSPGERSPTGASSCDSSIKCPTTRMMRWTAPTLRHRSAIRWLRRNATTLRGAVHGRG